MLRELTIRNFAIIDDLNIRFKDGLSILSGETGAGKSIIINAVNLLLGSRADAGWIRTGADSAELEAFFETPPESRVSRLLEDQGYETGDGILIRRIISASERHRIYINNRLATARLLNEVTTSLASISGQHANQSLTDEEQHLFYLDRFDGLVPLRDTLKNTFNEVVPLIQRLKELENKKKRRLEHLELLEFQKNEIDNAGIVPGEDETLEIELSRLKNAETLFAIAHEGNEILYSGSEAVIERLSHIQKEMEKASEIDRSLDHLLNGISDVVFKVEDISREMASYLDTIEFDQNRLEEIDSRLYTLSRLKKKYGGTLDAVLAQRKKIETELSGIDNLADEIENTVNALKDYHNKLSKLAIELSEKRKTAALRLSKKVEQELNDLNMKDTRFEILLETIPSENQTNPFLTVNGSAITETGIDRARFLISPNVGEALKPLAAIASGGELSRVVLALKAILAKTDSVETVIFDEVDAGIGGNVAEMVGKKMSELSRFHQVLCITHLPQIAKFGDNHYRIEKQVRKGRTRTSIDFLNSEQRIEEIARMLGGASITQTTRSHAREMLQNHTGDSPRDNG